MEPDGELIIKWLNYMEHNRGRSAATTNKYYGYLTRLQAFLRQRGHTLGTADRSELEEFTGLHAHKAGLAPRSRRAMVAAIRGFYKWRAQQGAGNNPSEFLHYPSSGRTLPTALDLKSAQDLLRQPDLETFSGVRDCTMMAVLIGCGLRISGLCSMNESSLRTIDISGVQWLIVKVREKGKKERLVPAPHETRLLLQAYMAHPDLEAIDRSLPDGDKVLFVSVRNRSVPEHEYRGEKRRMAARSVNDMIIKYGQRAGIPRAELHPHALRHLYGTELAEADTHLLRMQALLGHADPKDTQMYTHLAIRTLAHEVERANPLRKINTPVTEILKELQRRNQL